MINLSRRGFLTGLMSALAAPAIVRAESLMPVKVPKLVIPPRDLFVHITATDRLMGMPVSLWIKQEDADRVRAGLHPRYSIGVGQDELRKSWTLIVGDIDDKPRLAMPWLQ